MYTIVLKWRIVLHVLKTTFTTIRCVTLIWNTNFFVLNILFNCFQTTFETATSCNSFGGSMCNTEVATARRISSFEWLRFSRKEATIHLFSWVKVLESLAINKYVANQINSLLNIMKHMAEKINWWWYPICTTYVLPQKYVSCFFVTNCCSVYFDKYNENVFWSNES